MAFASHWNGSRWTAARTATVGGFSDLAGIACPGRSLCLAVGDGGVNENEPLAERLDG